MEEYFTKVGKYWNPPYKVNPDFSEDELTEIEKANIKNLLEEEKKDNPTPFSHPINGSPRLRFTIILCDIPQVIRENGNKNNENI